MCGQLASQYVRIMAMSGHRFARTFRPEPGEYDDALATLRARGRKMDAFLRSCLRSLRRDPDRFLAALADDWPPARHVGGPGGDRRGGVAGGQPPPAA
jgi:hypothetical protein